MVAADFHGTREQPPGGGVGFYFGEFVDGGCLGNRDVVKHAERADNEATEHQPGHGDIGQVELDEDVVFTAKPAQVVGVNGEVREPGG